MAGPAGRERNAKIFSGMYFVVKCVILLIRLMSGMVTAGLQRDESSNEEGGLQDNDDEAIARETLYSAESDNEEEAHVAEIAKYNDFF